MSITKNSKVAKATSAFVGFTTALMMVGGTAVLPASAATLDELLAQIAALTAQLNALKGASTSTGVNLSGVSFSRNLSQGATGEDVRNLQKVLNLKAETQVAVSGAGSPGGETTFFGPATKAAVTKFQDFYASDILAPLGLSKGTGFVGASTRAKLDAVAAATAGSLRCATILNHVHGELCTVALSRQVAQQSFCYHTNGRCLCVGDYCGEYPCRLRAAGYHYSDDE